MLRPVVVYTLLRFVLFCGAYGVLLVAGVRNLLAIVGALVLSALGSVVLLRRQRDAIGAAAMARRDASLSERERLQARLRDES